MIENEMTVSVPLEVVKTSEIEPKEVKWLWYPYIKEVKAKAFLMEMLKDGEMLSSDCEEKLEAAGFRKSTIKKAKKNAGVISRKKGFLWYWSLPMGDIPRE